MSTDEKQDALRTPAAQEQALAQDGHPVPTAWTVLFSG